MRNFMLPRYLARWTAAFSLAIGLGCSSPGTSNPVVPARLAIVTGPGLSGSVGLPLDPQPRIQVQDASGNAVASRGLLVVAAVGTGGGTLMGTTSLRTDENGLVAFTDLAIAGATGSRVLLFTSQGLASVASSPITLSAGLATTAVVAAGNNQTSAAGTPVIAAPSVRVSDASGNPVPGVTVTFAVTGGGGNLSGPVRQTGADGVAAVGGWTLGTLVGLNTMSASVSGLTTSLGFSATGTVGPAAILTVVEGDGQSATIGTPVATAPGVKITDAFGNPVPGLAVTFAVATGGGSLTTPSPVSDASGVARVGSWRLGLTPGAHTITASRTGATVATFTGTATHLAVTSIAAGAFHSCAVATTDSRCWGDNPTGNLGTGTTAPDSVPVIVSGALVLTQVSTGTSHSCGLTAAGAAWCWGLNTSGQLGDGTPTPSFVPIPVIGGHTFTQISAGATHTCGLRTDGGVYCWGIGTNGRLGYGGTQTTGTPTLATGGHLYSSVSAGGAHTCGLRTDGTVLCWGANAGGRLGDGTVVDKSSPTAVTGVWAAVSAGGSHTCAIDTAEAAWCWGVSSSGQGGTGTAVASLVTPTTVAGGLTFSAISAGTTHTCAVATGGAAHCWGLNGSGRLGDGTVVQRNAPVVVSGGLLYTLISAGGQHTCARATAGSAICWGRNLEGELGDGTTLFKSTPVGVRSP